MKPQYSIIRFNTIDSTNNYVKNYFNELKDMQVVLAEQQTAGRGRQNRTWVSPPENNIYMTIVLKNQDIIKNYIHIGQLTSLAVADSLKLYNLNPGIKWPNDILINNKKISGILCESILKHNNIQGFALGVGININMSADAIKSIDQPATSVNLELGVPVDKEEFIRSFLAIFFNHFQVLINKGFQIILKKWKKYTDIVGKKIILKEMNEAKEAEVLGFNEENGALIIRDNNLVREIYSGDILRIGS